MLSRRFMEKSVPGGLPLRSISAFAIAIRREKAIVQMTGDEAVAVRTRRGQPVVDSQTLPEMSHFAAEF